MPACWHKETVCASCKKKAHISAVCRPRPKQAHAAATSVTGETKYVSEQTDSTVEEHEWRVLTLKHTSSPPILAQVQLSGKEVTMEVDTGALASLMSVQQWKSLGIPNDLDPVRCTLRTFTGESVAVLGQVQVQVRYQQQEKTLPLLVVKGSGFALLGQNWLSQIRLDWHGIYLVRDSSSSLQSILDKHQTLFAPGLGCMLISASISLKPGTVPKLC